jgi:antitoxin MazE
MTMRTTIKKWGNSAALRIPQVVMESACLALDQNVDLIEENGRLVIIPAAKIATDLQALLDQITPATLHGTLETGQARGHEVW